MEDVASICRELREEEWRTIHSLYPDVIPSILPPSAKEIMIMRVEFGFSEATPVNVIGLGAKEESPEDLLKVEHLPPLLVSIELPSTYPIEHAPVIHAIQSEHEWLPSSVVPELIQILMDMWDESLVLDLWLDFFKRGEKSLSALGIIETQSRIIRLRNPHPRTLIDALSSYDRSTQRCLICHEWVPVTVCLQLSPCNHVACRQCLRDFWGSLITEGRVSRVGCPHPECVKQSRQASLEDAKNILLEEQIVRWKQLLQKQETERDPTITYCPMETCQQLVQAPPPSEDGIPSEWDRLRECRCGYTFCIICRRAWHGAHTQCPVVSSFVGEYLKLPTGSPEREAIERTHGKNNVIRIVKKHLEDQKNQRWMQQETMPCPGCRVRVQKTEGCNHMTCVRCKHHFCYRCGSTLDPSDPYAHFDPKGNHPCSGNLFHEVL